MDEFIFGSLATTDKRANAAQIRMRGVRHHYQMEPRAARPTDQPVLTVTVELPQKVERVVCVLLAPETAVLPMTPVSIEWDLLNWAYYQVWQVTVPAQPEGTVVRYQIQAFTSGRKAPLLADDGAIFSYFVTDHHAQPEWARAAITYQIFPDRFHPGNGRFWQPTDNLDQIHGGTLRGIIENLDYIADLGFNCLWLNPFFPDDSHHGYHATDYFAVNPRLGTIDDIRELVAAAHERGMRLLLDFVANHWSNEHDTFVSAQTDPDSPYRDWYNWIEWPHHYECFFGVQELPQLNTDHPDVRQHLFDSVRYWLSDVGFDGLRLDYVLGPTHDFWTALRAAVAQIKPDAWLYGEAVDTPVMQLSYEGRFHGSLDFVLAQSLRKTFGFNQMDIVAFDAMLQQHEAFFPTMFSRPSFLDNHDMARFSWVVDNDKRRLKLAALCQFTLAGQPIVYNGSEVGVVQERGINDPGSHGMAEYRQPMIWGEDQDKDLHAYFRWLIHLRRDHPVLWRGTRQTLHVDGATQTYAYLRADSEEKIVVGLNLSDVAQTFIIRLPSGDAHTFALDAWAGDVMILTG